MIQTGIRDGFCCHACGDGKDHGPRCLKVDFNDNDWQNSIKIAGEKKREQFSKCIEKKITQ